ncbi:anti-sigma-K factor RskA [Kribbella sp. VKM Ac-2571]|uniref:anti-sigma factor n=1 Tax=Kribbella sp. VKM Ac-2571 TaxID=2512222 RepID=UPI00105E67B9|nr:anti-sigma factor [Kribbella sp. VKM Ac-2571]TDO48934.1 anti-sigma-K factor RskA [Kribbella sp. VKM Ac-2571]
MHVDEEQLARWALEDDVPDPAAADHLRSCDRCRAELDELRRISELAHSLPSMERPSDEVWTRIAEEVSSTSSANHSSAAQAKPVPLPPGGPRRRGFRSRTLAAAATVAAVAGAGIGIGATLLATDEKAPATQMAIRLEPLAGKSGAGSADLVQASGGVELKVSASGLGTGRGFYEVWLINTDGRRMVSLGVLNPRAGGTFQVPAGAPAQGYRIVDISLEPDDGNPEHSHDSIVRGTLPG